MRSRHRGTGRGILAVLLLTAGAAIAALPATPFMPASLQLDLRDPLNSVEGMEDDLLEEWTTENRAPVADAGADLAAGQAEQVWLTGSASFDPDGDALTFEWKQLAGPPVILWPNPNVPNPVFVAPMGAGRLTFRLRVADREENFSYDSVHVTLEALPGQGDDAERARTPDGEDATRTALALLF
jgi:hypothetical protein